MIAKVLIKKKIDKIAKTKYGDKQKYSLLVESVSKKQSFYVDVWGNKTTGRWKEGEVVEIDIEKTEYNGKVFYNGSVVEVTTNEIYALLKEVKELLSGTIVKTLMGDASKKEPEPEKDGPNYEDEGQEEIPF